MIGIFAFTITLLIYLPFLVSMLRMAWRDTETRRMIFYKNCIRLYSIVLLIDIWVMFVLTPDFYIQCSLIMSDIDDKYLVEELDLPDKIPVDIY